MFHLKLFVLVPLITVTLWGVPFVCWVIRTKRDEKFLEKKRSFEGSLRLRVAVRIWFITFALIAAGVFAVLWNLGVR